MKKTDNYGAIVKIENIVGGATLVKSMRIRYLHY